MKIFLAGGAGYIGCHTALQLLNNGYEVVIADNFSNSCPEAVKRVEALTGKKIALYEIDVQDGAKVKEVFAQEQPDAVIHFVQLFQWT